MIRLDNVNRSIVLSLDGTITTYQLQIIVNYSDNNGTTYTGGTQTSLSNNTTQVTICSAPTSSTIRDIDNIIIFNNDTVANSINIFLNDNSTLYQLAGPLLQTGESFVYTHSRGWETVDINGCLKTSNAPISQLPNNTTGTTQTLGDSSTKLATDAFVANAISNFAAITQTIQQVTVDLGSQPRTSGHFNITGSGFSPILGPVIVMQAATRPNSVLYDNIEMDAINCTGIITSSTTIQVNWNSDYTVANQYTFNYFI
jgi:hypothetical protein